MAGTLRRTSRRALALGAAALLLIAADGSLTEPASLPAGERLDELTVGESHWFAVDLAAGQQAKVQIGPGDDALEGVVLDLRWLRPDALDAPCSAHLDSPMGPVGTRVTLASDRPDHDQDDPCRQPGRHLLEVRLAAPETDDERTGQSYEVVVIASVLGTPRPAPAKPTSVAAPPTDAPTDAPTGAPRAAADAADGTTTPASTSTGSNAPTALVAALLGAGAAVVAKRRQSA